MSAKVRERTKRRAHARISAEEERTNSKIGLFILLIVFVVLVAILLRLAEFAGRGFPRRTPQSTPTSIGLTLTP